MSSTFADRDFRQMSPKMSSNLYIAQPGTSSLRSVQACIISFSLDLGSQRASAAVAAAARRRGYACRCHESASSPATLLLSFDDGCAAPSTCTQARSVILLVLVTLPLLTFCLFLCCHHFYDRSDAEAFEVYAFVLVSVVKLVESWHLVQMPDVPPVQ